MSLLRTAARASVAARVVGNVQRRQHQTWAAQDAAAQSAIPQQAPVALAVPVAYEPASSTSGGSGVSANDLIGQLQQLAQLRDAGVLTETEFEVQKQRLLGAA